MSEDNVIGMDEWKNVKTVEQGYETGEEEDFPSSETLEAAKEKDFETVLVIGRTEDDRYGFITNCPYIAELNYMLEKAKLHLLLGD